MTATETQARPPAAPQPAGTRTATSSATPRRRRRRSSLLARGEPLVWLTGGTLILLVVMILGLLTLVSYRGGSTFWPGEIVQVQTLQGASLLGEVAEVDSYEPSDEVLAGLPEQYREGLRAQLAESGGVGRRFKLRTGNFDLDGTHYDWVDEFAVAERSAPEWALVLERLTWGRFYGLPVAFRVDGEVVAEGGAETWERFREHHDEVRRRWKRARGIEKVDVGRVDDRLEAGRLQLRRVELRHGEDSPEWRAQQQRFAVAEAQADAALDDLRQEVGELDRENARFELVLRTAAGREQALSIDQIVRAVPANRVSTLQKLGIYASRWFEFLSDDPREANNEGGVFPAIFGTVVLTLLMSLAVVPFGVLAALYLREYATQGFIVSTVRIAVNNLAGVPSIVYGVFGLGFFCYVVGVSIDELLFAERLPNPTYGTGGILWASLTLALLTLPVVIVATEEALSAVPSSMREGSYACGASKWQTIRRIVLPRAMPGIMTGMILAIARGAGEVAPLMLVGAMKTAPKLPIEMNGVLPVLHPERSFMHLGFHIYDLGFQSQNSEAAKPMVFTTTLLLIGIVVVLNVFAIWIRGRLRRRFQGVAV